MQQTASAAKYNKKKERERETKKKYRNILIKNTFFCCILTRKKSQHTTDTIVVLIKLHFYNSDCLNDWKSLTECLSVPLTIEVCTLCLFCFFLMHITVVCVFEIECSCLFKQLHFSDTYLYRVPHVIDRQFRSTRVCNILHYRV